MRRNALLEHVFRVVDGDDQRQFVELRIPEAQHQPVLAWVEGQALDVGVAEIQFRAGLRLDQLLQFRRVLQIVDQPAVRLQLLDVAALDPEAQEVLAVRAALAVAIGRMRGDGVDVALRVAGQRFQVVQLATEIADDARIQRLVLAQRAIGLDSEDAGCARGLVLHHQDAAVGQLLYRRGFVQALEHVDAQRLQVGRLLLCLHGRNHARQRLHDREGDDRGQKPPAEHDIGHVQELELLVGHQSQPVELLAHPVIDLLPVVHDVLHHLPVAILRDLGAILVDQDVGGVTKEMDGGVV